MDKINKKLEYITPTILKSTDEIYQLVNDQLSNIKSNDLNEKEKSKEKSSIIQSEPIKIDLILITIGDNYLF